MRRRVPLRAPPCAALLALALAACASGPGAPVTRHDAGASDAGTDDAAREEGSAQRDSGASKGAQDSGLHRDAGEHDARSAPADATRADSARSDAGAPDAELARDASVASDASSTCEYGGAPGACIDVSACSAMTDHTPFAGHCPGAANIQCCIVTPSTADNPPTPTGYVLMQQSQVTPAMTTWAVMILNDPTTYPMFATATMAFGSLDVLARVEWHPPDFQNSVVHRGVTLYVPG